MFNIIVAGRKLQEALGQKPLVGIITGILPGTDGLQRMSKSTGNIVPINTGAEDMYGKVMSLPDSAMPIYFKLVSRYTPAGLPEHGSRLVGPRPAGPAYGNRYAALFGRLGLKTRLGFARAKFGLEIRPGEGGNDEQQREQAQEK